MKLLEENNYLIRVNKCHSGINMILPERRMTPHTTSIIKKYSIRNNILFSNEHYDPNQALKPTDLVSYATHCAIYMDILQHCKMFRYNPSYIKVENDYGIDKIIGLLPPMSGDDERKSNLLFNVLFNQTEISEEDENEILEGLIQLAPYSEVM